jgi:hypothetical protein
MEYLSNCTAVHGDEPPTPAPAATVASAETTSTKQTSISGEALIVDCYAFGVSSPVMCESEIFSCWRTPFLRI